MTWTQEQIVSTAMVFMLTTLAAIGCNDSTDVPSPTPTGPPVPPAPTYTIQISPASISLFAPPGEPRTVVVTATVRNNSGDVVSPAAVVWATDSTSIATVAGNGTVTGVREGGTLLRARFGGTEATAAITVAAPITFTLMGSMSIARLFHTATLLPDGKVLIVGGMDRSDALGREIAVAELYDPATNSFVRTGDLKTARSGHSAALLPNGKVLIAGGIIRNSGYIGSAELYDPASGTFSLTGDLRRPQAWHEATMLKTGKVLITGGLGGWSACCPIVATPELYDPATGEFATTGTYTGVNFENETYALIGLTGTKATLLRDGRVFVTSEPATQVYDPVAATFTRSGTMLTGSGNFGIPHYINGQTATLLNDGKVLLTGGHHEDIGRFKTAELFDPASGSFTRTADLTFVRDGHTATLLSDGTVLVTGGESESGCAVRSLNNAEKYDPSRGGFVPVGKMNVRREWHTATRLKDGSVLVTGGLTFDGGLCAGGFTVVNLASAELYIPNN